MQFQFCKVAVPLALLISWMDLEVNRVFGQAPAPPLPFQAAGGTQLPTASQLPGQAQTQASAEEMKAQLERQNKMIADLTEAVKALRPGLPPPLPLPATLESPAQNGPVAADANVQPVQNTQPSTPPFATFQPGDMRSDSMVPGVENTPFTSPPSSPPFANMPDSFGIRSPNGEHEVHLTGQIQGDLRQYDNIGDTKDTSEFLLRRARLGFEGVVFSNCEFRVLPDFGNNKVVMQDCLANLHYFDWLQVMGGKFKEPVSFEEAFVQDRFVPTVERSIIDQITPARDIGLMVHGRGLFYDQFDYYIGVFNGEINADSDTNGTKDYAGRIAWRLLNYEWMPEELRPLQIGVSATIGKEQEYLGLTGAGSGSAPSSGQTLQTSAKVTWLTFAAADYANGLRTRIVPEVSYFYGPFGMCAEYIRMDQRIQIATNNNNKPQDIPFEGYMLTATYMLTGESHKAWGVFRPFNSFDPSHPFANPGAWELVAAVSRLRVDSCIFKDGLASAAGNSSGATEMTLGFNWYLNTFVKVQFNWEHAYFDQAVNLNSASGTTFRNSDALLTRLQLAF